MEDLSLHVLDIIQNSIRAGADRIDVKLRENREKNVLTLIIRDNGCGMDREMLAKAEDPFFSAEEGKQFGFGISLLAQAAEETGGWLRIESAQGAGTIVTARFHSDHIDMKPVGDIKATMDVLQTGHPSISFRLEQEK